MAHSPTPSPSVPDYGKLAATLADLGARAADLGRIRGDQDLQRLAQRLHGYAHAIQRDLGIPRGRGLSSPSPSSSPSSSSSDGR